MNLILPWIKWLERKEWKMLNKFLGCATFFIGLGIAEAQESKDSLQSKLTFGGYVESYYTYDFNKPEDHKRPGFIYSHHRSNELSVNLAMIKANYSNSRVRSNLALAVGSYMNANYAAEEGVWKNVYEANLGYKLLENHELWIDAGVLPSHIGGESAIGLDNISLSRSLSAENSPYFETGARLSYTTDNGKFYLAALVLNGWQRIQLPNSSKGMSLGHQIQYKPNESIVLNSSSYYGDEGTDSTRFFHDLYVQVNINSKFNLLANWDYGIQKQPLISENFKWWNAGLQANYLFHPKLKGNARLEYFNDEDGVIFGRFDNLGTNILGYSLGIDVDLYKGLMWRTEFRGLNSTENIFTDLKSESYDKSYTVSTAIGWKF